MLRSRDARCYHVKNGPCYDRSVRGNLAMRLMTFVLFSLLLATACAPAAAPSPTAKPAEPARPTEPPKPAAPAASPAAAAASPVASPVASPSPAAVAKPVAAGKTETVKVAHAPSTLFAPLYVAIDKGYLAAQGIEVQLETVAAGQD